MRQRRHRNVWQVLWCVFILMNISPAWAWQSVTMSDHDVADVYLAKGDMTPISVTADRIQTVFGKRARYELGKEGQTGTIYLRPIVGGGDSTFMLHLTTEQGEHYSLRAHTRKGEINPVVITAKKSHRDEASARRSTAKPSYEQGLIQLLMPVVHGAVPAGMSLQKVEKAVPQYFAGKRLQETLERQYNGKTHDLRVYRIKNTSRHPIRLQAKTFMKPKTESLAWTSPIIPPHGRGWLYEVRRHVG